MFVEMCRGFLFRQNSEIIWTFYFWCVWDDFWIPPAKTMHNHCGIIPKVISKPKHAQSNHTWKPFCKRSTQIQWKSLEIQNEAPTTSSHMPPIPHPAPRSGMWEEVVGASLWISGDFQWIGVDFLHVDSHFFIIYKAFPEDKSLLVVYVSLLLSQKLGLPFFNTCMFLINKFLKNVPLCA